MRPKTFACFILITLLSILGTAQQTSISPRALRAGAIGNGEWAQFNFDAGHDGYNPNESILGPTNVGNVTLQWSYLPSNGYFEGSPAVSDGIVYFGVEDTVQHYHYAVYALNANTGDVIWNYATAGPAYGSPAVAFGLAYVVGGDVYAFDASTGSLHWQWQSPGSSCLYSPTLVNGILYVVCDSNYVYALNAATGTVIWQYQLSSTINSSPAISNGALYVCSQDGGVHALNASTGTLIWSRPLGVSPIPQPIPYITYGSLSVANGVVYIQAADPKSRQRDYNVWALDATTGATIWKSPSVGTLSHVLTKPTPAVANGMVYAGSDTWLYALNASNGTTAWQYQLPDSGTAYSPIVANGVVYAPIVQCCGDSTGTYTLAAVDADTGEGLWSTTGIFSMFDSYPTAAVVNGTIYSSVEGYGFAAFGLPNQQRSEKIRSGGAH